MSFAHHDIEDRVAQVVPADAPNPHMPLPEGAVAKVLVISTDPALGQSMAAEMASDTSVEGHLAQGVLGLALNTPDLDLSQFRFVVFEVSADPTADLVALMQLRTKVAEGTHFIAMTCAPLNPVVIEAFTSAGAHEVLNVGSMNAAQTAEAPKAIEPDAVPDPVAAAVPATMANTGVAPIPASAPAQGKVTVLLRARGGAGATTMAVNLAVVAAETHGAGKVALVDLDIQNGALGLMMDMVESTAATSFIKGTTAIDAGFVEAALIRHESGVDVMTAPDVFAPLTAIKSGHMALLLSHLQAKYDHIIIDMPQGVVEWVEPVLAAATRLLIVSDTTLPSVIRTRRLMDIIAEEHMTLPIEIVMNQHKKPKVMTSTLKEVERLIGRPLTYWVPPDAKSLRRASDLGQPLVTAVKRARASRAIAEISSTLFGVSEEG